MASGDFHGFKALLGERKARWCFGLSSTLIVEASAFVFNNADLEMVDENVDFGGRALGTAREKHIFRI